MNRPIFFILSAILIFSLLMVWVYIIFLKDDTSSTTDDPIYNIPELPDLNTDNDPNNQDQPIVEITKDEPLRQLTLGEVVGYQEVSRVNSSDTEIYYIKAGTGHIMSINLETGAESRVSGNTLPSARKGVISQDGEVALIQSGSGSRREFKVLFLNNESGQTAIETVSESMIDFSVTTNNTFLYTKTDGSSLIAAEYNPTTRESATVFTIPFREAVIVWGDTATSTHYIYPKTSSRLEGYAYSSTNGGSLKRLPISGLGLSLMGNDTGILYSVQEDNNYLSYSYSVDTSEVSEAAFNIIPEKCASRPVASTLVCGVTFDEFNHVTPDTWYEGTVSYVDSIMELNPSDNSATYLVNISTNTGRDVDLINPLIGASAEAVYFQNKNDQTLWMYVLPEIKSVVVNEVGENTESDE